MIHRTLYRLLRRYAERHTPGFVIGAGYLYRWWLIPRNPLCNVYLHQIRADDDDRALHTHPWINLSIVLDGGYWEHVSGGKAIHRGAGSTVFRWPSTAHELFDAIEELAEFISRDGTPESLKQKLHGIMNTEADE